MHAYECERGDMSLISDDFDTCPECGAYRQDKGYCASGHPRASNGSDSDHEDLTEARRAVRTSARVMALRGGECWLEGAYVLINVAAELGLTDEQIRADWKRGYRRAEHLLSVLRADGMAQGKETD